MTLMKSSRIKTVLRSWWFALFATVFVALSFRSAVADWNDVPTGSMKPTILEGDRIFVNKLAYDLKIPFTGIRIARWAQPERGDIVVFRSPADGKKLVKRVIGLPGDTVLMEANCLSINGEKLDYQPAQALLFERERGARYLIETLPGRTHWMQTCPSSPFLTDFGPVKVPDGYYLMLGDNRDISADSRVFGFVPRRNILGRATAVALSLDINNGYAPRWERFFTKLYQDRMADPPVDIGNRNQAL
jgi:signal peptidase I